MFSIQSYTYTDRGGGGWELGNTDEGDECAIRVLLEATQGTLVIIADNAAVTVLAERVLTPLHATLSGKGHVLWESHYGNAQWLFLLL